ncbi:hypothetical protein [Methylibium sp. Root1272]|jgi:hypothetical protein|uniref:hypothetical protein n=1 Tax=Methylibium sp. Root1272 TaxID=1736441 RepID=UPI0006F56D7E|nr:hypothetical protein [Methylibium sp. Root1272]KQW76413.1 hypothetical protein ASC67_01775 [Methylibium sp. Root1272]
MKLIIGSIALATLTGCATAVGSDAKDEHKGHHPTASPAAAAPVAYEQQMAAMHEMHRKMAAAKTPEERAALMKDHRQSMQDGMAMMGRMREGMGAKGSMAMDPETMKRRMDMMEMMMQLMMDREATKPPAER